MGRHSLLGPSWSPDPKRCSTFSTVSNTYASITFERPCVPPKTHRIWNGRQPPDRLPLSFWRYAWPFKSYNGVNISTFHVHAAPFGIRTRRPPGKLMQVNVRRWIGKPPCLASREGRRRPSLAHAALGMPLAARPCRRRFSVALSPRMTGSRRPELTCAQKARRWVSKRR